MTAPGGADGGDRALVGAANVVAVDRAALAVDQALGVLEVLDHDRQAVQRAQRVAAHHRRLRRAARPRRGALEIAGRDGVDGGVDRLDPGDAALQQLDRREPLGADQPPGLDGGEVAGFGHARFRLMSQ